MNKIKNVVTDNIKTILILLVVAIAAFTVYNAIILRNVEEKQINVTGLGTVNFQSDLIVWSGSFSQIAPNMRDAYTRLSADQESIRRFLKSKSIAEKDYKFSSVNINKEYDMIMDNNGNQTQVFKGYRLTQDLTIESKEVDKIEQLSREITELINSGVELYSQPPQYYYTKLSELKMKLIEIGTRNAKERAETIAKMSGYKLGTLKYANMGVFQIIAQNSNEDFSWDGSFNTDSKMKTATITIRLQFGIK
jgi:uncharacterized protein